MKKLRTDYSIKYELDSAEREGQDGVVILHYDENAIALDTSDVREILRLLEE